MHVKIIRTFLQVLNCKIQFCFSNPVGFSFLENKLSFKKNLDHVELKDSRDNITKRPGVGGRNQILSLNMQTKLPLTSMGIKFIQGHGDRAIDLIKGRRLKIFPHCL